MKRLLDITIALLLLPLLGVTLAVVAVVNRLTGAGPAIFRQTRNGENGQTFSIYKLRTMRVSEDGTAFRQVTRGDDRITGFGRILRATSLDELPQLLNVLRGEMSIVGPRPHPALLDDTFRDAIEGYDQRFRVRPGITGLAQVRGYRGPTETVDVMKKRIESDLEYVERASVLLDLKIILRTFAAMLAAKHTV